MLVKTFLLDDKLNNAGDVISKPILEHLGYKIQFCGRNNKGKLLAVGSVMSALRENDTVWGTGCIRDREIIAPPNTTFIAVRGPNTKALIKGTRVPKIYGDPALLLPELYDPEIEVNHAIGYIPHYVDKGLQPKDGFLIDIQSDWHTIVDQIKSCELIVSSSLHGIVFAEAYGVPAMWARYSDKIIGGDFKFQDYFLGTGRTEQTLFSVLPPIENLDVIQKRLKESLWNTLGK